ncbi:hypothetical protein V5O48_010885 [Marasmius crinis-equi]|uniref:F-box domain-containing protein n=1 Tax=Marasmius crinis-equi TaxID=585013 RepID=A0ABR3F768_9AGAR
MPTLDRLSDELLSEVFELVYDSSRHTIFSLLRVNKAIYRAALPFVYRECAFNFSQGTFHQPNGQAADGTPFTRSLEKLAWLLELQRELGSAIRRRVRKVVVHSNSVVWEGDTNTRRFEEPPFVPSEELIQAKWGSFIEFISRVANLREVVFDCPERVPIILLKALEENHPACRLHVKNWTRLRSDVKVGDPYEEALARSPCLRSIDACFLTGGLGMDLNYAAFERILAISPNLEAIGYTTRAVGGCEVYVVDFAQRAEAEREAEKFTVLHPVRKSGLKKIRWSGLNYSTLQRWDSFIDLGKVEALDLGRIGDTGWMAYVREHGTFTGLKHLSFDIRFHPSARSGSPVEFKFALDGFLSSCPTLKSLSIVNYHGYIDLSSILLRHGHSLRSLALHEVEDTAGPRPVLIQEELSLIRDKALHLERLELDINRAPDPTSNESATYEFLSSIPNLRHLTIHYDLGVRHKGFMGFNRHSRSYESDKREAEQFRKIYTEIDEHFAREVWRAVRANVLEELVIYDGEPDRALGIGYPARWVRREREQRQRFHVGRNERDDLRNEVSAVRVVRRGRVAL